MASPRRSWHQLRAGKLGPVQIDYIITNDVVRVSYAGMEKDFPGGAISWPRSILEIEIQSFVQYVEDQQMKGVKSNGISGQGNSQTSGHPAGAQSGAPNASLSNSSIINSSAAQLAAYGNNAPACAKCGGPIITQRLAAGLCDDCFTKLLSAPSPSLPAPPAAPPPRAGLTPPASPAKTCMACGGGSAGPTGLCSVCYSMLMRGLSPPPFLNRIRPLLVSPEKPSPRPLPVSEIRLGEIIAWRGWRADGSGYLRSFSQSVIWPPGEAMEGRVSSEEHGAGVYAFKSKKLLFDFMRGGEAPRDIRAMIWGSVALWGDVVEHDLGWRAQFAAIASLDGQFPADGSSSNKIGELRQRYGFVA